MSKEFERLGIPTVFITSLISVAKSIGVNRIMKGSGVMHPVGDPKLSLEREKAFRRRLMEAALESLQTKINEQVIFGEVL